jgi:hypothetical protein
MRRFAALVPVRGYVGVSRPKKAAAHDLRAGMLGFIIATATPYCGLAQQSSQANGLRGGSSEDLRGTVSNASAQDASAPDDASANPLDPDAERTAPQTAAPVINYGQRRPKKPQLYTPKSPLYQLDPKVSRPLPPLEPYVKAPGSRKRQTTSPASDPTKPAPSVAVIPAIPGPLRPKPDEHPFDPLGVDVGSLRMLPFVELGGGYDSNPNRLSSGVKGSPFGQAAGGLDVNSQWSNHSLTATLRGGYSDFFDFHEADRPNLQTKIDGRIDVTRDTKIEAEGRFTLDTQQPGSQQLAIPGSTFIVGRPLIESYGATLGVAQSFDRLTVRLRGTYDRLSYEDALQSDTTTLYLSHNDYNDYGLNAHVSYEVTPAIIPYVDVTGDQRHYDSDQDVTGYNRTSNGINAKAGTTFELTRLVTADMAGGYLERHYDDTRLANAKGPTLDGSIIWTPSALTKVTLSTGTDFIETTLAGATGAISRRVGLQVSHSLFRNFTLTGIGTYQVNTYQGAPVTEHLSSGSLLAEYSLTRDIVLRATYRHERFTTTLLSNYTADAFLLGVRLQR